MILSKKNFKDKEIQNFWKLLKINSISSWEDAMIVYLQNHLKEYDGELTQQPLKNLLFSYEKIDYTKPLVLIDAHIDEVGLAVANILKNGMIKVLNYGGIDCKTLLTNRFVLYNEKNKSFYGTCSTVPPHCQNKVAKFTNINDLVFDFGFKDYDDAKKHFIKKDCRIEPDVEPRQLINDRILTKGADNFISIFLSLLLIEDLKTEYWKFPFQLVFSFSTQEEVGLRSIQTLKMFGKEAHHLAFVLDTSPCVDQFNNNILNVEIGKGTLLRAMDAGIITNSNIFQFTRSILEKNKIPHQFYISPGATNAAYLHMLNSGIKVGHIITPARNIHSVSSIFSFNDVLASYNLLYLALNDLNAEQISNF